MSGEAPSYGTLLRTQVGLLSLTVAFMAVAKLVLLLTTISAFALPVAALSLWVAFYLDRRTAFMMGVAASFLPGGAIGPISGKECNLDCKAQCKKADDRPRHRNHL